MDSVRSSLSVISDTAENITYRSPITQSCQPQCQLKLKSSNTFGEEERAQVYLSHVRGYIKALWIFRSVFSSTKDSVTSLSENDVK